MSRNTTQQKKVSNCAMYLSRPISSYNKWGMETPKTHFVDHNHQAPILRLTADNHPQPAGPL